ncbi:MAG: GntR family transcriptional regulator [Gammaproteobacteria bacterium]|jgi:DNA-binding GntR family transcriptional regulator|nr:GntR family transcriptional regulator [Gammaproteobacteria bacterium]MBU0770669.1 GntR family transcriptional regulator [Gammaproteobacteria bacterium]MBU0857543.1 GntR family transcriptional regulator [Gammaproteobacteria bacterium]MBU1848713.1 GntR family transcriptional regulator [Gammaproteobacteria bacterium]
MDQAPAVLRLSEQLGEKIEERIVTGSLRPGMRLDEQELAAEFGVSRTPIREALIQLASAGLVDMRPRRGAVVSEIEPHRLCEMFDVMAELEAMCARLAARRITDEEITALRDAHQACETARDADNPDAYYWLNEQFHRQIYQASHNGFLAEQAIALHRRLRPYRRLQLRVRNRMKVSYAEHGSIVDAIIAGDGDLAATRIRGHIQVQGERFADLVASVRQLTAGAA